MVSYPFHLALFDWIFIVDLIISIKSLLFFVVYDVHKLQFMML